MSEANKLARARQAPPRTKDNDRWHATAVCNTCDEEKRLTEFDKNGTGTKYPANDQRRYRSRCKSCSKIVSAARADPNFKPDRKPPRKKKPTKKRKSVSNAGVKRKIRRRTRIACLKYLAKQGCELCGERDPRVLEFDHLEPRRKVHAIATLISGGYAWSSEILRREIRKCRILCANCHRKHTIEQQDYYSHPDVREALEAILKDYGVAE